MVDKHPNLRPAYHGEARIRQFSFSASAAEDAYIRAFLKQTGMSIKDGLLEAVLSHIENTTVNGKPVKSGIPIELQSRSPTANGKPVKAGYPTKTPEIDTKSDSEILEPIQPVAIDARTRADARTKNKKEIEIPNRIGSSLRSEQAAPGSDDWKQITPLKQTIRLSTGEVVTNMYVFANGCRLEQADVNRILSVPSLKVFRAAMLRCFARSIRDVYRMRWCAAHKKLANSWRDTSRSDSSFMKAAEYLAVEYINRGMSTSQFLDAVNEMRPRTLKFITADLVGSIGSRVAAWLPPEQRDTNKGWTSHMDTKGTQWVTPSGETPVIVLRTAEDRERFLQDNKVK